MSTAIRLTDEVYVLDLPQRVHNALRRNNVRTVGDLCDVSEQEFVRMRNVGERALERTRAELAKHGLSMPVAPPPPPDPALVAEAEWIGRQLAALIQDVRVVDLREVFGKDRGSSSVERRRLAWAFYRWGITPDSPWPKNVAGGYVYMAYPMPGSVELHLEGLNRLAREELG